MNIEYIHSQKAYRILNIFVSSNLTEYEYRIYLFLSTGPNTNIKYIRSQELGQWRILNIYKANFEDNEIYNKICIYDIKNCNPSFFRDPVKKGGVSLFVWIRKISNNIEILYEPNLSSGSQT